VTSKAQICMVQTVPQDFGVLRAVVLIYSELNTTFSHRSPWHEFWWQYPDL